MRVRDTISLALGAAALALAVLGVGGAIREVQAGVAFLVAAAVLVGLLARRTLDRLSPLLVLLGVAALLTAIQLLPLPSGFLERIDATGNALRVDGATLAQTSPWPTISLDPAGTLRALAFFITLLGVAVLALRFAASERGRYILLAGVASACGLAALVAGAHRLLDADALYGWYKPAHLGVVIGPLLNRNHMGGLMGIGVVLCGGLAFYQRQPTQLRVLWIVIMVGCLLALAGSTSRGAMIGTFIGMTVLGGLMLTSHMSGARRRRQRSLQRDLPVAIVIGFGVALALYASAGNVVDQLGNTSLTELDKPISKYEAWRSSLELVRESPVFGIGRGAVEPTMTRVHPAAGHFTFSHLENEYLTAVVEWGIPGALVLALIFAWCVKTAVRRWRDGPLAAAALGALSMILFQSSVDFGVELLGLAVPVTIIAATVQLAPLRPVGSPLRVRLLRGALAAGLVGAGLLALAPFATTVQEDHDELVDEESSPSVAEIRASIQRHPLDYFGFGEMADVRSRSGDIHAVDYLSHALHLHPTHPGLHRLAARMLVGMKRYKQAAVEYSLAMSAEPTPHQLLTEIVTLVPSAEDAAACIPVDYPNTGILMHSLKELKRLDIAERWLTRVAQQPQHDLEIIDMLYELAMSSNDLQLAHDTAALRLRVANTTTSRLMLARVQFKLREFDTLIIELSSVKSWVGRIDEKAQAWLLLCDVYIEQRQWDPALECIHKVDGSGLLQTGSRSEITKRTQIIDDQRTYESKMKAVEALEKTLENTPRPKAP